MKLKLLSLFLRALRVHLEVSVHGQMWGWAVGRGWRVLGVGGVSPLPACIPTGAPGLDPIVYIENPFSAPEWMTNPGSLPHTPTKLKPINHVRHDAL